MTISDIAKLAGVSVATVSRVINNKGYVKEETRRKIEEVIEANDYRPSAAARSLIRSETSILAVIMSEWLNPFFANVLSAIEARAEKQGYSILLYNTSEEQEKEHKAIAQAIEHRVKGILLLPVMNSDSRTAELLESAEESGIPVVLIDRDVSGSEQDIVLLDNKKVVYEGIRLLIEAGHRKIAIITCPETAEKGWTRLDGYLQCLEDYEIPVKEEYIYPGQFEEKSGYQACETLFSLPEPPEAVFAACSSSTLGCIRYMNEKGLQMGVDVGLVGFDDISLLKAIGYDITLIERPKQEMGELAYDLLAERMTGVNTKKRRREIVLQTRFLVRGSERRNGGRS